MKTLFWFLFILITVNAKEYTDEELSSFPKLFHLDNYDRCLSERNGVYCLGIFDLVPDIQPHPVYDILKEYSEDKLHRHFNRTRIHRGYCVSTRCPTITSKNASDRFELCADKFARKHSLRASTNTLHYCHTYNDRHTKKPSTPAQSTFLQSIYAIIAINVMATIYDLWTKDDAKKNKLISAFSITSNWKKLTSTYVSEDARLAALSPLNGVKVLAMLFTMYAHSNALRFSFYTINPEELERQTQRVDGVWLSDGTSLIKALIMMACFLTCYNLLIFSQKRPLDLSMLPLCIIKRIIRSSPVNLLLVSFGATWWIHIRDGPLVHTNIGIETKACQNKFWSHVFYYNNFVDRSDYCFVPTWSLPVDLHMYIVACILTLVMWRHRCQAVKLYSILLITSCVVIGVIAYVMEYKSMIYLSTPENLRVIFRETESFRNFYISSWAALPSCFVGLILAHIQFELNERRVKLSEHKWFVYLHNMTFPILFVWPLKSIFILNDSPSNSALHAALDSPLYCILMCILLLGLIHVEGPIKKVFAWNGWNTMARMSLTVLILHWCVNVTIATRPMAFNNSFIDVMVDWTATTAITYILAVPITVLVEIPVQKFLGCYKMTDCLRKELLDVTNCRRE